MIFCKLKKTATWLQKRMTEDGHAVAMLTSDISIEDRLSTLNRCGIYFGKIYNNCSPFCSLAQITAYCSGFSLTNDFGHYFSTFSLPQVSGG